MKLKTLTAVAAVATAAAAFAIPLAQAGGDKAKDASADKSQSASQGASGNSGAEKMFQALDKDNDGKFSREEHAAAPEHAGDEAAAGGTSGNKKY